MAGNTEDDIIGGASNDDAESVLRKHLTSALSGANWDALVYAISRGDQINWDNAQVMLKQLNLSTAVGDYLEQRANDRGIKKPSSLGISDEGFRKYAIKRSTVQTTSQVLYEMMEVLYGSDAVRANITSIGGPYALEDGDDLLLWIDKKKLVRVVFTDADFESISNADPLEVATAITRACELNQSRAYAAEVFNVTTGESQVRFYSQSLGPSSAVVVLGGKAQNVLQFPTLLNLYTSTPVLPAWQVRYIAATGRTRFTAHNKESGPHTNLVLNGLQPGDYVNIFYEFNESNQGSLEVKDVYYAPTDQWFEVELTGVDEDLEQSAENAILFFRRTYGTTFAGTRTVSIVQKQDEIRATFPATSVAVTRELYTGAYVHVNPTISVTSVQRDNTGLATVTTSTAHGFSTGDWVILDGIYPDLPGGAVYAGDLNGLREVTVVNSVTFTYETPETLVLTSATGSDMTVMAVASVADSTIPGPFIFETDTGFAITDVSTTITQNLNQDHGYTSVLVSDASDFTDTEGWLVFAFGTKNVAGPVKLLGKLSNTELLIDGAFHFPDTIASGANVILLSQKGPLTPDNASELGSFYATAASAGHIAASEVLDDMTATGFTVNKIVVYPGDRGLGAEGFPSESSNKLSDKVTVWGGNDPDGEYAIAQEGD